MRYNRSVLRAFINLSVHGAVITGPLDLILLVLDWNINHMKKLPVCSHYRLMTPSSTARCHLIEHAGPRVTRFSQTSAAWLLFLQVQGKHFVFTLALVKTPLLDLLTLISCCFLFPCL